MPLKGLGLSSTLSTTISSSLSPLSSSLSSLSNLTHALGTLDWRWKAAGLCVLAPLSAHLSYRLFFATVHLDSPSFYNNKSHKFLQMRRKAYPPGFPRGWYAVASVHELGNGRIKNISCLGVEMVAFMDNEGRIAVMSAHCPHLGAHLGCDGKLVAGRLQCPYHGWQFDATGKCVHIPYSDAPIPSTARARTYTTHILAGVVFVWFDSEGGEPLWDLVDHPDLCGGMVYHRMRQSQFNMHVCEMAENSPDYFHFTNLHGPINVPVASLFFHTRHETTMFFEEGRPHVEKFHNWATTWLFNRIPMHFTKTLTEVTFEGPALIHFEIFTDLGRIRLFKTQLPIDDFHIYAEDRWFAEPSVPRWLVWIVSLIARGALEQDRTVWENKVFHRHPMLVKGDGPFRAHRKWWLQFYNQSQLDGVRDDRTLEW